MHTVYVIYSKTLNKYYIGETENVKETLVQHNTKFFNSAYTGLTNDWELFLFSKAKAKISVKLEL
ncbi:MAG: GIY-YIG nuclease family protein [Flavobacterium sp.]